MAKKAKTNDHEAAAQSGGLSEKVKQTTEFFEQAKVELKKVTWPTKRETTHTATAVLILVAVMALFLGLTDMFLSKIVGKILS